MLTDSFQIIMIGVERGSLHLFSTMAGISWSPQEECSSISSIASIRSGLENSMFSSTSSSTLLGKVRQMSGLSGSLKTEEY